MTIDVEDVCTHDDLVDELHSQEALERLLPKSAAGSSLVVRRNAWREVVGMLKRRTPPIAEADLSDPAELKQAVIYGSLARLYLAGITTAAEGDVHWTKWKHYRDLFADEVSGVAITTDGGSDIGAMSFDLGRR